MSLTSTAVAQNASAPSNQDQADRSWPDPRTGLIWVPWDNGKNVTWAEALSYCRTLEFEHPKDWRLPSIEELEGIYDASAPGLVGGPIERSSEWFWSATRNSIRGGNWGASAWLFSFVSGPRIEHGVLTFREYRALCVRPERIIQSCAAISTVPRACNPSG